MTSIISGIFIFIHNLFHIEDYSMEGFTSNLVVNNSNSLIIKYHFKNHTIY